MFVSNKSESNVRRGEQDKLLKYILKERERRNQSSAFYYAPPPAESSLPIEVGAGRKADVNIEEVRTAAAHTLEASPFRNKIRTFRGEDSVR